MYKMQRAEKLVKITKHTTEYRLLDLYFKGTIANDSEYWTKRINIGYEIISSNAPSCPTSLKWSKYLSLEIPPNGRSYFEFEVPTRPFGKFKYCIDIDKVSFK